MMLWIMLVIGLISLGISIYCFRWHGALDKHFGHVDYWGYLISGLGAYLLFPASLFIIGGSMVCLLVK